MSSRVGSSSNRLDRMASARKGVEHTFASQKSGPRFKIDEIEEDMERLKEEKRSTEHRVEILHRERSDLEYKIEELRKQHKAVDDKLQMEQERDTRLGRSIQQSEAMFAKLIETSESLSDFVRKECQETRRERD